jgi:membrane protease YdiL (CAAX protease family)
MGDVILGFVYSQALGLIPAIIAIVLVLYRTSSSITTADDANALIQTTLKAGPVILTTLIASWAGMLIAVWWAGTHKGDKDWRKLLKWHFQWKRDIPIAIAFTIIFRLFEQGVGYVLQAAGVDPEGLGNSSLVTDQSGIWLVLVIIGASIGAPFVEEIFFRGMFLSVAVRNWGRVIGVILVSAVFGIMHAQTTLASSIYTIAITGLIGVALALLVLKTNRLGTSISAHVLFNSSAVILFFLTR